jgi:hypothetical protein
VPVVFLDVDGVLNHPGTWRNDDAWRISGRLSIPIDVGCMERLNRLLARTSAQVVVSSSWRLCAGLRYLTYALRRAGLRGEVVGATPDPVNDATWLAMRRAERGEPYAFDEVTRGAEIAEWLRRRPVEDLVDSFVILDDASDMGDLTHRLVSVDGSRGLCDADVLARRASARRGDPSTTADGVVATSKTRRSRMSKTSRRGEIDGDATSPTAGAVATEVGLGATDADLFRGRPAKIETCFRCGGRGQIDEGYALAPCGAPIDGAPEDAVLAFIVGCFDVFAAAREAAAIASRAGRPLDLETSHACPDRGRSDSFSRSMRIVPGPGERLRDNEGHGGGR